MSVYYIPNKASNKPTPLPPPHIHLTSLHSLYTGEAGSAADNRGVFDDGAAQGLTEEDVVTMKGQGVKGQVRLLVLLLLHLSILYMCSI